MDEDYCPTLPISKTDLEKNRFMLRSIFPIVMTAAASLVGTGAPVSSEPIIFQSGFEELSDFSPFYITPVDPAKSALQELSCVNAFSGRCMHRAWITRANPPSTFWSNNNHRAYPTIQFQKTNAGPAPTPVCIMLRVWADFELHALPAEDQWISLATLTDDLGDRWQRTVLVNVGYDGRVHLQHVPIQGQQVHIFQSSTTLFPFREWVRLQIEFNLQEHGYAKVWLDGVLVSHANIDEMGSELAQAHFGLYAAPSLAKGEIRNDDLLIVSGLCAEQ